MPDKLTDQDYQAAANLLQCDVASIKAVAEVESRGDGFLSDGRVKVLFEGHQFYKFTNGLYATSHPTICYQKWTTEFYAKGATADIRGAGELARLEEAMSLDRTAALKSASYGKFQIMGFNFQICGFTTVDDFYQAVQISEGAHLNAFCSFIKANSLDAALRESRWADFANKYNGPDYQKNQYDTKLAAAYGKYATASA
ncbi:MAG: N-acetylmuramidase family protein [Acidobacteriia bacterium]|nr:N-acetylmuramidase family protein [Terriglobia bacterium]